MNTVHGLAHLHKTINNNNTNHNTNHTNSSNTDHNTTYNKNNNNNDDNDNDNNNANNNTSYYYITAYARTTFLRPRARARRACEAGRTRPAIIKHIQ